MRQSKEIYALMQQDRLLCCEFSHPSLHHRILTSTNRFQMPDMVDSETPKTAMSRTGFDGQEYELVFSDEFNTPGRTFYPGAYFSLSWCSSFFPLSSLICRISSLCHWRCSFSLFLGHFSRVSLRRADDQLDS